VKFLPGANKNVDLFSGAKSVKEGGKNVDLSSGAKSVKEGGV
jgi:hypothetical protein